MSRDAHGQLEGYVKNARAIGLVEIGVSDHYHPGDSECSMSYEELIEQIQIVQLYKPRTTFPVKLGVEVDFVPGLEAEIAC